MTDTVRVMLSSRCNDPIQLGGRKKKLSDLRRELKRRIEGTRPFGRQLFECWINEDAPPADASQDSWDECLKQVRKAHLVVVLYNGDAGWATDKSEIGICHAELATALDSGRAKVYLVELPPAPRAADAGARARNARFQEFKAEQSLFRGTKAEDGETAVKIVMELLNAAMVGMVELGVREARKGKYDTGEALDWSRLNLSDRQRRMVEVVRESLRERRGSREADGELFIRLEGKQVLVTTHAVPGSMATAATREMVGRPFVKDFAKAGALGHGRVGPVHLIAGQKRVTENQAVTLLGHPDVTVVTPPFGVHAVDNFRQIQVVLLADCRDETSTRHAVQRMFEWLQMSGEAAYFVRRAEKRRNIVQAIAKEYEPSS